MFQMFLESWRGQAAKKKDKAGDGAEAEKPKPVAFGCEAGHSIRPSYRTYGTYGTLPALPGLQLVRLR
jgi:hypothetical protein